MKRFNNILCVVDPKESAETAIIQSVKIAIDHQAELTFVSVLQSSRPWGLGLHSPEENNKCLEEFVVNTHSEIKSQVSEIAPSFKPNIEVSSGIGFIQIIKRVIKNKHDLVVKCAEDIDWMDRMLGSEDMHLLRKCPCPVLMLKPEQKNEFRNILATVDVNDNSVSVDDARVQEQLNERVLEYSAAFCMSELMELRVGSAWEAYAEDLFRYGAFSRLPEEEVNQYIEQVHSECSNKLNKLVKEMDSMLGKAAMQYLQPKIHLVKGKPSKEIPLMAEIYGTDLIVMGTVGRIGVPGLIIGNTAESILEQVQCSILAIKPEGFKTPVA